jgi:hypothetical protein
MAEESPNIFFEVSSQQIHSILYWHPGEERHHIEIDHYVQSATTCSRWFFARGFFYPEDGGDTFLRNVGSIHKIYTAPHDRRRHSSLTF